MRKKKELTTIQEDIFLKHFSSEYNFKTLFFKMSYFLTFFSTISNLASWDKSICCHTVSLSVYPLCTAWFGSISQFQPYLRKAIRGSAPTAPVRDIWIQSQWSYRSLASEELWCSAFCWVVVNGQQPACLSVRLQKAVKVHLLFISCQP